MGRLVDFVVRPARQSTGRLQCRGPPLLLAGGQGHGSRKDIGGRVSPRSIWSDGWPPPDIVGCSGPCAVTAVMHSGSNAASPYAIGEVSVFVDGSVIGRDRLAAIACDSWSVSAGGALAVS